MSWRHPRLSLKELCRKKKDLNSSSSCLHRSGSRITGLYHYASFYLPSHSQCSPTGSASCAPLDMTSCRQLSQSLHRPLSSCAHGWLVCQLKSPHSTDMAKACKFPNHCLYLTCDRVCLPAAHMTVHLFICKLESHTSQAFKNT